MTRPIIVQQRPSTLDGVQNPRLEALGRVVGSTSRSVPFRSVQDAITLADWVLTGHIPEPVVDADIEGNPF